MLSNLQDFSDSVSKILSSRFQDIFNAKSWLFLNCSPAFWLYSPCCSIDAMSEILRDAIERSVRLKQEVVLAQEDFIVNDVRNAMW